MTKTHAVALAVALGLSGASGRAAQSTTPAAEAEALLAVDRGFAAAASAVAPVGALTAMFTPGVIVPGPPGTLHRGLDAVAAWLRAGSDDADGHLEWTPIRVGLSADARHGFTFGFMTQRRENGTTLQSKYMAYWVKSDAGWRVAGYKRTRRPEGDVPTQPMPPVLPAALVPATTDPARLDALRGELAAAERAFSDEAQRTGLGAAFAKWGHESAVNMGGPASAGYVVGAAAIGRHVGAGAPGPASPVAWSTDTAIVASSGDLGISFGYIRPNGAPPAGGPPGGVPFFTIWYRAAPGAPWRYIAE